MLGFEKRKSKRTRAQRIARLNAKIARLEKMKKEKELEQRLKEKLAKLRSR